MLRSNITQTPAGPAFAHPACMETNPPMIYGHRHCVGITRRELLQVGYSALLGLGLPELFSARAGAAVGRGRSQTKSVILVFLTGGPSQLDTFDLKPEAPAEIRGECRPIATAVPGLAISEHLPRMAARAQRWALIRSLSHGDNSHLPATHHTLTGRPMPLRRGSDLDNVLSRRDAPCYAAGLDYLWPRGDGIPSGVTLPHALIEGPLTWPGQHAGFLGPRFDPWQIAQDPNDARFRVDNLQLPSGVGVARLHDRRILLDDLDRLGDSPGSGGASRQLANHQEQAFSILASSKVARAFAIEREPAAMRDRYGRHMFGQTLLLARRLVEAGVPIVQANMGIVQTWDTHSEHFARLKDRLLPPLDQGFSALLDDLEARGLLEGTLVVMLGEFGRSPRISTLRDATSPGRDHWAPVYSGVFAGGGVRGGQVIGKSDKLAAHPASRSFGPDDVGATVYHALGIDPASEVRDRQDRPVRLNTGQVIEALYSGAPV
jgi:hypothetical protein